MLVCGADNALLPSIAGDGFFGDFRSGCGGLLADVSTGSTSSWYFKNDCDARTFRRKHLQGSGSRFWYKQFPCGHSGDRNIRQQRTIVSRLSAVYRPLPDGDWFRTSRRLVCPFGRLFSSAIVFGGLSERKETAGYDLFQLAGHSDRKSRRGTQFGDRKSTRLNSSHANISYAVF